MSISQKGKGGQDCMLESDRKYDSPLCTCEQIREGDSKAKRSSNYHAPQFEGGGSMDGLRAPKECAVENRWEFSGEPVLARQQLAAPRESKMPPQLSRSRSVIDSEAEDCGLSNFGTRSRKSFYGMPIEQQVGTPLCNNGICKSRFESN